MNEWTVKRITTFYWFKWRHTQHPFLFLRLPPTPALHSPPRSSDRSLKSWWSQWTKLTGCRGPAGAVLSWEFFYVKRMPLFKYTFDLFRLLSKRREPLSAQEAKQQLPQGHCGTKLAWSIVSLEGLWPPQSPQEWANPFTLDWGSKGREAGPLKAAVSASTPGGGPTASRLCRAECEDAGGKCEDAGGNRKSKCHWAWGSGHILGEQMLCRFSIQSLRLSAPCSLGKQTFRSAASVKWPITQKRLSGALDSSTELPQQLMWHWAVPSSSRASDLLSLNWEMRFSDAYRMTHPAQMLCDPVSLIKAFL